MPYINKMIDRVCFQLVDKIFQTLSRGKLIMELPDGTQRVYGKNDGELVARVTIYTNKFFRRCVLYGSLGLGESYVDGDWDTENIEKLISLVILNIHNNEQFQKKKATANFLHLINKLIFLFRSNSLKGSKSNISDHYDLGNDFFKTFLDPSMTYSSAYFQHSGQSLQEAQYNKYEQLCRKLKLSDCDHVLEIGSGWGGIFHLRR